MFQNLSSAEQSNNNNTHNVTPHTPHEIPAPILPSKPKGGRHAQLARLLRLRNPFERKAISVSIQRPDGTLAESPRRQRQSHRCPLETYLLPQTH